MWWPQRSFFKNFGLINSLAVLGTIISTFVVGYGLYGFNQAGIIDTGATPLDPLLFGSLISAIDPVATLSLFSSLRVRCAVGRCTPGAMALNRAPPPGFAHTACHRWTGPCMPSSLAKAS